MLEKFDGAIEITEQQYSDALAAKIDGRKAFVRDGELIIYTGKVTAYLKADCTKQKEFNDKTLVTDDYTLNVPATRFDEWINDEWLTNQSNKYIVEYDTVDSVRRNLYLQVSDPLYNKARRLERNGEIDKANDYYAQADASVIKIEAQNPWPINPLASQ
ncbi:phage tail protein [Vibrio anguillarum]|uniref:Phage tail protein n=8 Tax=Vibrio anguillarum TaxID=55601 RepID=A0A8I0UZ16_VIBAN|nr:phage tail protein [Vibrio anguillarum]MBF4214751.1 phage tail protein [Vibrio anguillarum]MBF4219879.1 phage tail protein [Vibrio anguillarum]MBF4224440.1 phage tail protein [Vibrio anguillarum]MBF4229901.1 phage tail protein [Vibrio anguillarum]